MSSAMKDARWALALQIASNNMGLEYEDFTYSGWQKLLDEAQARLDLVPQATVNYWAEKFNEHE